MGALSRADNATLYAYVNNDDGTLLAEEAKRELAARGLLPEWASAPRSRPMPDNVQGNLDAAAAPINDDPVLVPGMRRGVAGPRRDDGTDPAPAPEFSTQAEADRYYTRPTDPTTGMLTASPADTAMAQRGFVPVYGAAGEIGYQIGFPAGEPPASARTNRERQHYERKVIIDPRTNKPALAYDVVSQDGPTGTMDVLAPTDALRAAEANRAEQKMMERLYAQAGLPIPVGQSGKQYTADELRALGRNRREDEAAQRRQAVVRTRQAQTNPLEYLGRSDVSDWQRMAVAERYLRTPQTMTPLGVDAVGAANAMRMLNADTFAQGLPGAMEARERLVQRQRFENLRGVAGKAKNSVWFPEYAYEAAEEALINEGASAEERAAILEDLFGPGAGAAKPTPAPAQAPAADAPSAGQYFPGQQPVPPPRNPLAAPRPFG